MYTTYFLVTIKKHYLKSKQFTNNVEQYDLK